MKTLYFKSTTVLFILSQSIFINTVKADDLEILEGGNGGKPNVIFILDGSNSVLEAINMKNVKSTYENEWSYTPDYYNPIINDYLKPFKYIKKDNSLPSHRQTKQQIEKINWSGFDSGSEGYGVIGEKTQWVQYLPKINILNDIVREMIYLTSERGGVNLSIMTTAINHNEFDAWYVEKKSNVRVNSYSDKYPNDNGSFVLEAFQDTSTISSADALVKSFFSKGRDVPGKLDHGHLIRETKNNISSYRGTTPLSESLLEAYYYFTGNKSIWNKSMWDKSPKGTDDYYDGLRHYSDINKSWIDITAYQNNDLADSYQSPWNKNACGENHIIFYTDGNPTWDWNANNEIVKLTGANFPQTPLLSDADYDPIPGEGATIQNNEQDTLPKHSLMDDLAKFLYENDLSNLSGKQNIHTHIVTTALPAGQDLLLSQSAKVGGGVFVNADNFADVLDAIKNVYTKISETKNVSGYKTLLPPSAANPLQQSDYIYLSFFGADKGEWVGNVKKYQFANGIIVDKNKVPVFQNGVFNDKSIDLWNTTNQTDGTVLSGGAASQLNPVNANRHTVINNTMVGVNQNSLKANDFQVDSSQLNDAVAKARSIFSDSVHVKPVFFNYFRNVNGTSNATLFLPTNSGFLHAFNAANGAEQMAFIPYEFLPNIGKELNGSADKLYGLDGGITLWHDDLNNDQDLFQSANGNVDKKDGVQEKLYLYASAGRGGPYVYGLNVTNVKKPNQIWKIDSKTNGFGRLGNAWSKPIQVTIPFGNKADSREVVLFGNGDRSVSEVGAIYMVDALTGKQQWHASKSDANTNVAQMDRSIVSEIKTLDYNFDGLMDAFFALDTSGQIFRCDISRAVNGNLPDITCGRTAQLGPSDSRRFYNNLDLIVLTNNSGIPKSLALAVGSGDINEPNADKIQDRFYVVFDKNPLSKPNFYTTVFQKDLSNSTKNEASKSSEGWYIDLAAGEKVLTDSLTLNNNLIFQTYMPSTGSSTNTGSCASFTGSSFKGKLHVRNIESAKAITKNAQPVETTFATGLPDSFTVRQSQDADSLVFTVGVGNDQPQSFQAPAVRPIGLTDDVSPKVNK
ncbi:MAG: hypothetical protein V4629_11440 [Pseudomonadota bacterium]